MPSEADAGLMEPVYQDRDLRGKVLSEIRRRPDTAVNRIMILMAEVWVQGFHAGRGDAG